MAAHHQLTPPDVTIELRPLIIQILPSQDKLSAVQTRPYQEGSRQVIRYISQYLSFEDRNKDFAQMNNDSFFF
jgi:hypothetical protein